MSSSLSTVPDGSSARVSSPHPRIIQGGMGIGVSDWRLAKTVSELGQLGVVSGTCLDTLLVRRLQDGDLSGDMRRAMNSFPLPGVVAETLKRFFVEGGKKPSEPYKLLPMQQIVADAGRERLTVLASFVEVFLAKEGHDGKVGINLLTKIQMPTLATLYGAMLAGVDYVLMGAGIPREIPAVLDNFSQHKKASIKIEVQGTPATPAISEFDPVALEFPVSTPLKRPYFLPIVSSHSLATMLAKKASGVVDGFIVEHHTAGGHNAPPREEQPATSEGEPVYGPRDEADISKIRELGLPFWLAGGRGSPEELREALSLGGTGIQVGTLFAFCDESGITSDLKREVLDQVVHGKIQIKTDGLASPTGYPFKVVGLAGSLSESDVYEERERMCDLGLLRSAYTKPDGSIGFRCPGEDVDTYVKKGGALEDTVQRKCLCNSLLANVGKGQVRGDGMVEPPLLTSGDQIKVLGEFLNGRNSYTVRDVLDFLMKAA